jgi:uncharacterized protein DUF3617
MSTKARILATGGAAAALLLVLAAADRPSLFAKTAGGMWELSGVRGTERNLRQCVANPAMLARFEHRGSNCSTEVVRNQPTSAEIHYSCSGGDFGRTTVTLVTPRSLRIDTQGISRGAPFNYVLHARRVGDCPAH